MSCHSSKALFRGVRASKYRHVYGSVARKDQCYDNINISKNAHDSHFCAVNPKFLAVVTESCGGGSFMVVPIDQVGRVDALAGRVTGHQGQIYDIKWSPFNDNVIASCSDDTTVKLWYIPDEGLLSRNMNQPIAELRGHQRRVSYIEWHPTADNILISVGFDHQLIVWNTARAEMVRVIKCHSEAIHSISFNRDGSLLATTCKDKKLRIIDPRTGKVVNEGLCHHGTKASKVVFLGDTQRLFTVGFSRYSDRQWAVWSQHDLTAPLTIENIDSSSGVLFPYYDHDTRMVYVAGKGDGNIRYYEITDEHPYCHYLSQFLSGLPQRGLGVMPKRGCDVYKCEILRFYKLHATKQVCEPISMIVPRKSEQFQSDIFPDTAAPTPAMTADQWLNGESRNPILFNLKSGAGAKTNKPVFMKPPIETNGHRPTIYTERKLEFISQAQPVDYREKPNFETPGQPTSLESFNDHHQDNHQVSRATSQQNGSLRHKYQRSQSQNFEKVRNYVEPKQILNGHSAPSSTPNTPKKSESALALNFRESVSRSANQTSRSRLPWIKKDEQSEEDKNPPMCDIVEVKNLPTATFVTINDDSDDSANTTDDSIAEEMGYESTNLSKGHSNNQSNGSVNSNCHSGSGQDSPTCGELFSEKQSSINDLIEDQLSLNPRNERELWTAFHEQRALMHNLRRLLGEKEKRIEELEKIIAQHDKDFISLH